MDDKTPAELAAGHALLLELARDVAEAWGPHPIHYVYVGGRDIAPSINRLAEHLRALEALPQPDVPRKRP